MPGQDVSYTVLARLAQPLPSNDKQPGHCLCSLASGIPCQNHLLYTIAGVGLGGGYVFGRESCRDFLKG